MRIQSTLAILPLALALAASPAAAQMQSETEPQSAEQNRLNPSQTSQDAQRVEESAKESTYPSTREANKSQAQGSDASRTLPATTSNAGGTSRAEQSSTSAPLGNDNDEDADALPKTASPLGLLVLLGLGGVASASVLRRKQQR